MDFGSAVGISILCFFCLLFLINCCFLYLKCLQEYLMHKEDEALGIQKEKVKEQHLHEICAVCLEKFRQEDELGICPCKHAFHRKCLVKWLKMRKVCPLCNMAVLQLAQQAGTMDPPVPKQQPLPGIENLV